MKTKRSLVLLMALAISGCGSNKVSLSSLNSSTSSLASSCVSEVISSSSSLTSSSTVISSSSSSSYVDEFKFGFGEETVAYNNPGVWYYWNDQNYQGSEVKVNESRFEDGTLEFAYEKVSGSCWYGAQLFYKHPEMNDGSRVKIGFDLKSPVAGKITINGNVISLREGTNRIEIESDQVFEKATLSIQFGTSETGLLETSYSFKMMNFSFGEVSSLRTIIKEALACKNYTIEYKDNTKVGKFTYCEDYVNFYTNEQYTGEENYGFIEDSNGIFAYKVDSNNKIQTSKAYLKGEDGSNLKGLHETDGTLVNGFMEFQSLPSLKSLDDEAAVLFLTNGEEVIIENKLIAYDLLTITGYDYLLGSYSIDSTTVRLGLNNDGNLTLRVSGKYNGDLTYVLTSIGESNVDLIDAYIANGYNNPEVSDDVDYSAVQEILDLIKSDNYTFMATSQFGYVTKVVTSNYVYRELYIASEDKTYIDGTLVIDGSLKDFTINDNGELVLNENSMYESLEELKLSRFNCFVEYSNYVNGEEGYFTQLELMDGYLLGSEFGIEEILDGLEISYNSMEDVVSLKAISSSEVSQSGASETYYASMGLFGSSNVEALDTYLGL